MKKIIFTTLLVGFTFSAFAKSTDNYEKVQALKNDKNFISFYNAELNFISAIFKAKKADLLEKFANQTANADEISEIAKAAGFENQSGLKNFLNTQANLLKTFSKNNQFLKDADGNKIINDALLESAKEGKLSIFSTNKKLPIDCLTWVVLSLSACYIGWEACSNNDSITIDCVAAMTACLTFSFNGYTQCHYLFE